MKVKIINGPNLNLLGIREPEIYGTGTYSNLITYINSEAEKLGISPSFFQSNSEGAIVDEIQSLLSGYDALIINAAAYTHTSIAIPDAIRAIAIPAIEVHLSDITQREPFRRISYLSSACLASFSGKGFESYKLALEYLAENKN